MIEAEVQLLMDQAETLRKSSKYSEAIKIYLKAVREAGEIYKVGRQDDLWIRKAISMASNGMGICYAKLGFSINAVDNFMDAEKHAPDDESRQLARRNLDKIMDRVVDKTLIEGKGKLSYKNSNGKIKKCLCDNPDCAKCLVVNCEDPNCKVHSTARKKRRRLGL